MTAVQNDVSLLYDPISEVLRSVVEAASVGYEVNEVGKDLINFFLIVVSYCCNISEGKYMSCVKYAIALTKPFVSCLVTIKTIDDIPDMPESDE